MNHLQKLTIENIKLDSGRILTPTEHFVVAQNISGAVTHLTNYGKMRDKNEAVLGAMYLDSILITMLNCATMTAQERFKNFTTPNMN